MSPCRSSCDAGSKRPGPSLPTLPSARAPRGFLRAGLRVALTLCVGLGLLGTSPAAAQANPEGLDCLAPPYDDPRSERQGDVAMLVAWLRSALEPYGSIAEILDVEPPAICLAERLFGIQGYYEPETHRIVLRSTLLPPLMRAVALHELRHVQQSRMGVCPGPDLSMQATGRVTLAMEADASAVSLALAWGLRNAGEPEVWNALANWSSHTTLAKVFEAEMLESGDLARATAAAFAAWYENDSVRDTYYVAACSAYLDRMDETHALPRYGAIASDYLDRLCRLPDGQPYPCDEGEVREDRDH